jgi:uncharacterized protein (DUF2252 family)
MSMNMPNEFSPFVNLKRLTVKSVWLKTSLVVGCLLSATSGLCEMTPTPRDSNSPLANVDYSFDQEKVTVAPNSFHFLRSFVDYFYKLVVVNKNSLPTIAPQMKYSGWCVGDAHAENFGTIIQKDGTAFFTANDADDSGPCPVILDLLRFSVGSKLYNNNVPLENIVSNYWKGLSNEKVQVPSVIKKMIAESEKKGLEPKESKVDFKGGKFIVDEEVPTQEITGETKEEIKRHLESILSDYTKSEFEIADWFETKKVGGGSGGLTRFEVLVKLNPKNGKSSFLHLEFKAQPSPSIYPVVENKALIEDTASRVKTTVALTQSEPTSLYTVVRMETVKTNDLATDMLVRPRFAGNLGLALPDNTLAQNLEVLNYEAYRLGQIHRASLLSNPNVLADYTVEIAFMKGHLEGFKAEVEKFKKLYELEYKKQKQALGQKKSASAQN